MGIAFDRRISGYRAKRLKTITNFNKRRGQIGNADNKNKIRQRRYFMFFLRGFQSIDII